LYSNVEDTGATLIVREKHHSAVGVGAKTYTLVVGLEVAAARPRSCSRMGVGVPLG
jgi:hypothetical protein